MFFFFFNDTATTEIYTLSLHDALPILLPCPAPWLLGSGGRSPPDDPAQSRSPGIHKDGRGVSTFGLGQRQTEIRWSGRVRSEEHTSELQSLAYLVCRLLLEKKKKRMSI